MQNTSTQIPKTSKSQTTLQDIQVTNLPKNIYIETTNMCNISCKICPRTYFPLESKRSLTLKEFQHITNQFKQLETVLLHGVGEPLLNAELVKMIIHLKSQNSYVAINSNGTLLDRVWSESLIKSRLDELRISIDAATPQTYNKVRNCGQLDKIIDNVKTLNDMKNEAKLNTPRISLWFVGMKETIHELPSLLQIAHNIGASEVYLQRLIYFGKGLAIEDQSLQMGSKAEISEYENILKRCEELSLKLNLEFRASGNKLPSRSLRMSNPKSNAWKECKRPWISTYITVHGNVLPCCFPPFTVNQFKDCILGNVFEEDFKRIWHGSDYMRFRNNFLSNNPPNSCIDCGNLWSL